LYSEEKVIFTLRFLWPATFWVSLAISFLGCDTVVSEQHDAFIIRAEAMVTTYETTQDNNLKSKSKCPSLLKFLVQTG
jgi:hypothetical protein